MVIIFNGEIVTDSLYLDTVLDNDLLVQRDIDQIIIIMIDILYIEMLIGIALIIQIFGDE
jgi:hypothetical protein